MTNLVEEKALPYSRITSIFSKFKQKISDLAPQGSQSKTIKIYFDTLRIHTKKKEFSESLLMTSNGDLIDKLPVYAKQSIFKLQPILSELMSRSINITPHEEQLVAGMLMFNGMFVEMGTGEGKTYALALAAASKTSLSQGAKVTIVSANDFLSYRDFKRMKPFFEMLNLSVAWVGRESDIETRKSAYQSDILYTTIREVAYDYLFDGSIKSKDELLNPIRDMILIDEADDVLIDKATQPYTINQRNLLEVNALDAVISFAQNAVNLDAEHFDMEEEFYYLTNEGMLAFEEHLVENNIIESKGSLHDIDNQYLISAVECSAVAIHKLKNGQHYIVKDGSIVPLDRESGRPIEKTRFGDFTQQALEKIHKLEYSGMSDTALSVQTETLVAAHKSYSGTSGSILCEAEEISAVFEKTCIQVPPKKPSLRVDMPNMVFSSSSSRDSFLINNVKAAKAKGLPCLIIVKDTKEIGRLSNTLNDSGIKHMTIHDKSREEEAFLTAGIGREGMVTITTAATGRGVDIILGGDVDFFIKNNYIPSENRNIAIQVQAEENKAINSAGGLQVFCYGLQPTKRLEQQALGRAGRQGCKGKTYRLLSSDDFSVSNEAINLLSIQGDFASGKLINMAVNKIHKHNRHIALTNRMHQIKTAGKVEKQRSVLYSVRRDILLNDDTDLSDYSSFFRKDMSSLLKSIDKKEKLKIFDAIMLEFNDHIAKMLKSSILQSYANKDSSQFITRSAQTSLLLFFDRFYEMLKSASEQHVKEGNPEEHQV